MFKQNGIYYTDFKTPSGGRIRVSTKTSDIKLAMQFEEKLHAEYLVGLKTEKPKRQQRAKPTDELTLERAFHYFENAPRDHIVCENRMNYHRSYWSDFVIFCSDKGVVNVKDVTKQDVFDYVKHLQTSGRYSSVVYKQKRKRKKTYYVHTMEMKKTPALLAPRTVNVYITTIKCVFRILLNLELIDKSPAENVVKMKNRQVDREAYTLDEVQRIYTASKDTLIFPIVIVGLCTGLRLGDICNLKCESVSDDWINIKVIHKTKVEVSIPIVSPLKEYINGIDRYGEYMFPELHRHYNSKTDVITKTFKAMLNNLGIQNSIIAEGRSRASSTKDIHSLRHTFAYTAGVNNIPINIVQSILGHMSPKMTQMYMAHANAEDKRRALESLQFNIKDEPIVKPSSSQTRDKKAQFKRILEKITPSQFERFKCVILKYATA